MKNRPARSTCFHEAGHILARWWLGFFTEEAVAMPKRELHREATAEEKVRSAHTPNGRTVGNLIQFERLPEELAIRDANLESLYRSHGVKRAQMALFALACGVCAEARYRKRSDTPIWVFGGGIHDYAVARHIIVCWMPGSEEPLEIACARAGAFLRSPTAWAAVTEMAEVLYCRGRIYGVKIEAICEVAFEAQTPVATAWDAAWPPTLAQFRGGYIPVKHHLKITPAASRQVESKTFLSRTATVGTAPLPGRSSDFER